MLCHRDTRSVVAYASQMFSKSTSEASPSFTNVKMGTSAAGYTVHEIFWHAGEMIMDGKGVLRASYLGDWIDVLASLATRALTCTRPGRPVDEFSAECTSMFLKLKSRLYATKGCCGKKSRVCWSVERILKSWITYRLACVLNGWYVRTKGTLSVVVSACSDPLRASGRLMAVTLRRSCSREVHYNHAV